MFRVSAEIDEDGPAEAGSRVGDMNITLVGPETSDPFALLDGWDAELGHIASVIFNLEEPGELSPDLDSRLEVSGVQVLILHDVKLAAPWRGFGLGPLLAGTAIRRLSGGARVAVCYPAPIREPDEGGWDDAAWDQAVAALQRTWGRLGFQHFRNGVFVLDLGLTTLDERLAQLTRCQRPLRNPVGWSWFLRAGGHQNSGLVAACSPGGRVRWPEGSPPCRRGPRRGGGSHPWSGPGGRGGAGGPPSRSRGSWA
jgi:hypothetical protein